ncbi:MAG: hypothetical protein M3237_17280 [Actinomycetota bacterium]|nr:hypothetical protein [Actinomycetota bacterium]
MDFWELTVILARRWYVFLPVLLVMLFGTYLLGQRVEPSYSAQASMLVAGPGDELGDGNPYADSEKAAQALFVIMASPEAFSSVSSQTEAPDAVDYTVSHVAQSAILEIYVDAPTAETALQTVRAVVSVIKSRLKEAQDATVVAEKGHSKVLALSPPSEAVPSTDGRTRVLLVGSGVSGLLALTAALTLEGFQRRRRPKDTVSSRRLRPAV